MFVGDAGAAGERAQPGQLPPGGRRHAACTRSRTCATTPATRTVLLIVGQLLPDAYTLTVEDSRGERLRASASPPTTRSSFRAISDLTALPRHRLRPDALRPPPRHRVVRRDHHQPGDTPLVLPVLLVLDPRDGYAGHAGGGARAAPTTGAGSSTCRERCPRTAGSRRGTRRPAARSRSPRRIAGASTSRPASRRQRAQPRAAVRFDAAGRRARSASPSATTAHARRSRRPAVAYHLLAGPVGMTIDADTGLVTWTPVSRRRRAKCPSCCRRSTPAARSRCSASCSTSIGGNRAPEFLAMPTPRSQGAKASALELTVVVQRRDQDALTLWADNLPGGATFDAATRTFTLARRISQRGDLPGRALLRLRRHAVTEARPSRSWWPRATELPALVKPADRTVQEGDRIRFFLDADGDERAVLAFDSDLLPWGATLHPVTGLFEWIPGFTQAGIYEVPFTRGRRTVQAHRRHHASRSRTPTARRCSTRRTAGRSTRASRS